MEGENFYNKTKRYRTDPITGEKVLVGGENAYKFRDREEYGSSAATEGLGNGVPTPRSGLYADEMREKHGTMGFPWLRGDVGRAGRITGADAGPALDPVRGGSTHKEEGGPIDIDTKDLQTRKVIPNEDQVSLKDFAEVGTGDEDCWQPPPVYKQYRDWIDNETGYFHGQFDRESQQPPPTEKFLSLEDFNESHLNIELEHLDLERDLMDDFTVVLIGRRRSGKTFFARWMMYHLRHRFPAGMVITGTRLNNFWAQHVPKEYIHDVKNLDRAIGMVFERQRHILLHPELGIDSRFFLILDDILQNKEAIRFSKTLSKCFTDGRHYNIFILVTTQDPKGISTTLRENADVAVIFRQFNKSRKEAVIEDFVDYIDNKKMALQFMWNHTGRVDPNTWEKLESDASNAALDDVAIPEILCCLQSRVTDNVYKIFKRAIAEDPGNFILGDPTYWKVQEKGNWSALKKDDEEDDDH